MCVQRLGGAQGVIVHEGIYKLIIIDTVDEDNVDFRSWWGCDRRR